VSVEHHRVMIVGRWRGLHHTAARLGRAEVHDVALIEPSDRHYYQPLWPFTGWERSAHGPDSAVGRYATNAQFVLLDFAPGLAFDLSWFPVK
jgi:hypothetical protein